MSQDPAFGAPGTILHPTYFFPLSSEPSFLALEQRFVELARVAEDWDSYGAAVVAPQAIAAAQALIVDVITSIPGRAIANLLPGDILPLATGDVQLIWQGSLGELDLDIDSQGRIGYLLTVGLGAARSRSEREDVEPSEIVAILKGSIGL